MNAIKRWVLAIRIERRWRKIGSNRRKMDALLENGEPYSSPALVRLDGETAELGYEARQMERRYQELMAEAQASA